MKTYLGRIYLTSLTVLAFFATTLPAHALDATEYTDGNMSTIFEKATRSFEGAPGLISAAVYIIGIAFAIMGVIKTKEYVEAPDKVTYREPIARFLIGGAFFALPTIMDTVTATIGGQSGDIGVTSITEGGSGDWGGAVAGAVGVNPCDMDRALDVFNAAVAGGATGDIWGAIGGALGSYMSGGTMGQAVCYAAHSFEAVPGMLSALFYISGIVLVCWGLLQLRDHILNPDRNPVSAPLKKLMAAGAFFAFPYVATVVRDTFSSDSGMIAVDPFVNAACGSGSTNGLLGAVNGLLGLLLDDPAPTSSSGGLDCMMVRLVSDLWGPVQMAVAIFCYIAGIILIAVAIRRMMDNMDKGAKSPVGIGTLALLGVGGALLSIDTIIKAVTVSIFPNFFSTIGAATLNMYGSLTYAPGVGDAGMASINTIITTVFAFSFLVGIISIVRGLFILKEVANGGNASIMAGFTHLIGGGLAVNLGPAIGAIQNTLGLTSVGIKVSMTPWGI